MTEILWHVHKIDNIDVGEFVEKQFHWMIPNEIEIG